jgi:hypothetical protein
VDESSRVELRYATSDGEFPALTPAGALDVERGDEEGPSSPLLAPCGGDLPLGEFPIQRHRRELEDLGGLHKVQPGCRLLNSSWSFEGCDIEHADAIRRLLLGELA